MEYIAKYDDGTVVRRHIERPVGAVNMLYSVPNIAAVAALVVVVVTAIIIVWLPRRMCGDWRIEALGRDFIAVIDQSHFGSLRIFQSDQVGTGRIQGRRVSLNICGMQCSGILSGDVVRGPGLLMTKIS